MRVMQEDPIIYQILVNVFLVHSVSLAFQRFVKSTSSSERLLVVMSQRALDQPATPVLARCEQSFLPLPNVWEV